MRFMGHNALAIFVAALAIYLIEFVIFAVLMSPEQYQGMSGYAASADGAARMPWGIAPPMRKRRPLRSQSKRRSPHPRHGASPRHDPPTRTHAASSSGTSRPS
mgnify:CR=1 FL=1